MHPKSPSFLFFLLGGGEGALVVDFCCSYSLCSHHVLKFSMCSLTCFPSSLMCSLPQHVPQAPYFVPSLNMFPKLLTLLPPSTCSPRSLLCSLPQHVPHALNVFPQQVSQVLNAFSQHFFNLFPIAIHFITFPCLSSTLVTLY
jgi:hypothetical protein